MTSSKKDVIIIGGGISGMSAAKLLHDEGLEVLVVEARDRLGGRTLTQVDPSVGYVDLGGSYVGPTQNRLLRLAKELGVDNYRIKEDERLIWVDNQKGYPFRGTWPTFWNPFINLDLNHAIREVDRLGDMIPVDAPWDAPNAEELDSMTMKEWIDKNCWTENGRRFFSACVRLIVTMDPKELSVLFYMWYIKQCGGFLRNLMTDNGGQERKFVGGSQQLSIKIGERVGKENIKFESPVSQIDQSEEKVVIQNIHGEVFESQFRNGRRFFSACVRLIVTMDPKELSVLFYMWYIKQCGGFLRNLMTDNGGQERKFVGGSQQLSIKIGERVGKENIKFESPVSQIDQSEEKVVIQNIHGEVFEAKYVIIAMAPSMTQRIHYSPPLPPKRNQLIARAPVGSVIKCMVYYNKQWWKDRDFCGSTFNVDPASPMVYSLDDTKPDGSFPALICFVAANKAREFCSISKEERRDRLCKAYFNAFNGAEEALHPVNYVEKNWMEEQYSGGCYTATYGPGVLTQLGKELRKPFGRLYFAGTETATHWAGYMEGGIQAGERAAREVLHRMGKIAENEVWQDEPESKEVPALPFHSTFFERNAPSVPGFLKFLAHTAIASTAVGLFVAWRAKYK
ncbi:amine oxidase [flavin-containing] B-like [Acanthaster planci]|uniref:Amine oxidase n=1 Tax=Acanthaster planci TaxID=133434 RepID=A0A8B7YZ46_ACAPL|nr:amine oxidase [flavin-containing] B-like [Acanthaster planci]